MTNPLLIRSVNDLLYAYGLSSAYRNAWIYDPDFALSKDPDVWETVRRDPVIYSAIDRRNRSIVRPWRVEPPKNSKREGDKLAAAMCEEALLNISTFDQSRYDLAQAALLGRVYEYIEHESAFTSLAGTPEMEWVLPTYLNNIDRRRFHWVATYGNAAPSGAMNPRLATAPYSLSSGTPGPTKGSVTGERKTHLEFYNSTFYRWEPVTPEFRGSLVEMTYNDTEDRLGYGRGLLEAIYFYHYFKTIGVEKVNQGLDRWANGILIGKLNSLRNASTSKTNEDLKTGMKTLLENMRTQHIVVLQEGDEIQVVESAGTGHKMGTEWVRYLDEGIERLLNGSIAPSGHAADAGSKARAVVEENTTESFHQFDRAYLDEVLSRDLIGFFWNHPQNRINFLKLGLSEAKRPKFHSEQEKREDPMMAVQVAGQLLDHGVPLVKSELYHKTGFSVPEPDDDVIEGRSAPSPFEQLPGFDPGRTSLDESSEERDGRGKKPAPFPP